MFNIFNTSKETKDLSVIKYNNKGINMQLKNYSKIQ